MRHIFNQVTLLQSVPMPSLIVAMGCLVALMNLSQVHAESVVIVKNDPKMNNPMQTPSPTAPASQFHYIVDVPQNPDHQAIILLHGSGGDEQSLFPFARQIWPRAILLGIRGRVMQEGERRWYRKISPIEFDQNDVVKQADDFVAFFTQLQQKQQIELNHTTFMGYSNGANLLAVVMLKNPDLVRRAILLRSMPALKNMPEGDLKRTRVLSVAGKEDALYAPFAPTLAAILRQNGAQVDSVTVEGDHMLGDQDIKAISDWLAPQRVVEQNPS